MPPELSRAHAELDRAVDQCYRGQKFDSDRQRVEFLFQLYEKLATPLTAGSDKRRKRCEPS
jgi:restriction-modification enzyme MmeI-like protein